MAGGEGSGKSFLAALYCICRSIHDRLLYGPSLYWIVGVDFEDARKEFGGTGGSGDKYILEWVEELGALDRDLSSLPSGNDQKCVLRTKGDLSGHVYETVSGYDPLKIGREQPRGLVGAEASKWVRELWERCVGRLARKGESAWGWFSGSFEDGMFDFDRYVGLGRHDNPLGIKSYTLPSWSNPIIYPLGRTDPAILAIEQTTSPQRFLERHAGRRAPPRDTVFPEFSPALHIAPTPLIPSCPVYLFVDPGDKVYAVLFVQLVGDEVRVVDEVYVSHWTHEQVIQECQMREAWRGIGRDGHVADVAMRQHHFGFGSPLERWYQDTGIVFFGQKVPVETSVERIRSVLGINPFTGLPRLRISPHCLGLIAEMGGGPSPVEGGGAWKLHGGVPTPQNDHSCKALAYGLIHHFGSAKPLSPQIDEEETASGGTTYMKRSGKR